MKGNLGLHGLQHAVCREALSFSISQGLLQFMSIELVILSNHLITLISFGIDWFDLLAIQGTQKSLLLKVSQFESIISLVLILLYSPLLTSVHDYWKNHSFVWTFVGKVMFPLLNICLGLS